jgi:DNA-binding NarL/FixJ family response regulator
VVVADDHPYVRAQLRGLLSAEADLAVVGTAWNGMEALRLVHELEPDVLVLDQDMLDLDGMQVAAHLRFAGIEIRVVLYTTNGAGNREVVAGPEVTDYVLDEESVKALKTAIRRLPIRQLAPRDN